MGNTDIDILWKNAIAKASMVGYDITDCQAPDTKLAILRATSEDSTYGILYLDSDSNQVRTKKLPYDILGYYYQNCSFFIAHKKSQYQKKPYGYLLDSKGNLMYEGLISKVYSYGPNLYQILYYTISNCIGTVIVRGNNVIASIEHLPVSNCITYQTMGIIINTPYENSAYGPLQLYFLKYKDRVFRYTLDEVRFFKLHEKHGIKNGEYLTELLFEYSTSSGETHIFNLEEVRLLLDNPSLAKERGFKIL